jgi:hypothetical protein
MTGTDAGQIRDRHRTGWAPNWLVRICDTVLTSIPRAARVVEEGVPHHVTQRGNNRQDTFLLDEVRRLYLDHLREQARHHGVRCSASA